jgi:tetratricopeptide (TPR) repeat protein
LFPAQELDSAKGYFAKAVAVSETIFAAPDLRTARALELYSIVDLAEKSSRSEPDSPRLRRALSYLDTVFAIRYELQGQTNIDTIETLNRIARVHMSLREYSRAKEALYEVFQLRKAIFGNSHPCVATASRALGVAFSKLYEADAARFYFRYALKICERNGTDQNTNLAKVLRKDLNDLNTMKNKIVV